MNHSGERLEIEQLLREEEALADQLSRQVREENRILRDKYVPREIYARRLRKRAARRYQREIASWWKEIRDDNGKVTNAKVAVAAYDLWRLHQLDQRRAAATPRKER